MFLSGSARAWEYFRFAFLAGILAFFIKIKCVLVVVFAFRRASKLRHVRAPLQALDRPFEIFSRKRKPLCWPGGCDKTKKEHYELIT